MTWCNRLLASTLEFLVSSLHLFKHIFVLLEVFNHIHIVLLLFILNLEDALSLLNHCGYYCVVDCIIDRIRAKNVRYEGSNHTLHLHLVLLFESDNITEKLDEEIKSILIYLGHSLDKNLNLLNQLVGTICVSDLREFIIKFSWNKGCLHLKKYFLPVISHNMRILNSPQKWKVLMAHMHLQLAAHFLAWRVLFKDALLR